MNSDNPLGMQPIEPGGPFVLSSLLCSLRRREYLERMNRHLAMYSSISIYANFGNEAIKMESSRRGISDDTPIRLHVAEFVMQTSYRQLKNSFSKSGAQLTNQVFIMLYGNFDAFLFDLVHDAHQELGSSDPIQDSISMLASSKWRGKLDRVAQKFSVNITKRGLLEKYKDIEMGFLGKATRDPIEFLQCMADLRHRMLHGGSRADKKLLKYYPESGLEEGQYIELPIGLPFSINYFYIPLTDYLDQVFCEKYGWPREMVAPENLLG